MKNDCRFICITHLKYSHDGARRVYWLDTTTNKVYWSENTSCHNLKISYFSTVKLLKMEIKNYGLS